ncbi:MAG: hypothetical protein A2275_00195 [Bacteroidetes bacterium RIFOXYA12_FULL_35_11]|nr:MAG: hypothetical protein A2X01_20650 [Bacteroidetes bacterium GWF2_35_48]OFY83564.1 MAG: hypothetical protein A2275_00195 [Bacteroidetes bacterium RIFOXYA12_FULL_35_11]OFY97080.1 MAG: hypothetical protein A2309_11125 [Bacteroidetes bacterium RIFOXYB2_FULL_35_7]OFZ01184.1 MAG: hypothetical protein A2491_12705 [Bacteroidetes bacterium RIFOXYC12_FULL_35_7]HBX51774.1 SAM-dependent methyltransferase [Bacteroidales bacterium]
MTNNSKIFDTIATDYDNWFERNDNIFHAEVRALKLSISPHKNGIEIGTGTGRFAKALKISVGVEPSENMAKLAQDRGISVVKAYAENLPFHNNSFGFVLFVTTVCFLNDIEKSFTEAKRILNSGGAIVIGFIDKNSQLCKEYQKSKNNIYKSATFYSAEELTEILKKSGFGSITYFNTLNDTFKNEEITKPMICYGCGKGNFIVIKALKN